MRALCVRVFLLSALTGMLSGCSILFLDSAPAPEQWDGPEAKYAHCDDRALWPTLDGVQVLASIGAAVMANDASSGKSLLSPDDPIPYVVTGVVYAAISAYGYGVVNECKAFREHQKVLREQARYQGTFPQTALKSTAARPSSDFQILQ